MMETLPLTQDQPHRETAVHEHKLIERAKNGDADAFGELYVCHMDAIYRYIYFRVPSSHDAEDLTEQVFLKAWESLPRYEHRGYPFTSWLYRIAHNIIIDHHRRHKNITDTPIQEQQINRNIEQPSSLEKIIHAEEAETLAKAVSQLPEAQQEVIVLRFIEGLDHTEISHILNKSNGACRTIQYRAISALNQILTSARAGEV